MNNFILIFISIILLTLGGCKDNTSNPTGNYSVSGKLIYDGSPLPDATVSLDNRIDLTTQSNSGGEFSINNVPGGDYNIIVEKTNPDGSFIKKSDDISVTDDIFIESLILPKGVNLFEPTNISATSMQLIWTSTDANDFREYKLYRHTSSGLDETTGTLIHVSTAISDTQFTDDDLYPLTPYFFRVYFMNEYGQLGGSNIVSSTSLNKNIIQNGSFEEVSSNFPINWNTWGEEGKFLSNSETAQEGSKSVKINLALEDGGVFSWGMYQQITPTEFEQEETYKISFWCKTDTLEEYESISCHFKRNSVYGSDEIAGLWEFVKGPRSAGDWEYFSYTLTIPANIPSNYFLSFDLIRAGTMGYTFHYPMISWIDNVIIEKVP